LRLCWRRTAFLFSTICFRCSPHRRKSNVSLEKRLVNLQDTWGDLHATDNSAARSLAPMFRGDFKNLSSAAGGQRK
jgi:hypothetical protein